MLPQILFLVGPTGSGKSELAIQLAKTLKGEVISCDAMLVYRGMNIGTAKLSRREQLGIRHHMINLVSSRTQFSVSRFRKLALKAIESVHRRTRLPIVTGGSGLYVEALIDGLAPQPRKITLVRKKLERLVKIKGLPFFYRRLQKIDPKRAAEILPGVRRRILRALEIFEALKIKPSEWRERRIGLDKLGFSWKMFGLMRERAEWYNRINDRVDQMMARGFLKEVKQLSKKGLSRTARQAIGYQEILDHLKNKLNLEEAVRITKQRTRNLAKKQLIWFRRERRIHWIHLGGSDLSGAKRSIIQIWKDAFPN